MFIRVFLINGTAGLRGPRYMGDRQKFFNPGTHRRLALEREFKYGTHIRGGVSTLHGANGKGLVTVSIVTQNIRLEERTWHGIITE